MKLSHLLFGLLCLGGTPIFAQNEAPLVTNVTAIANWANKSLVVHYDVTDAENEALNISIELSGDDGLNYKLTSQASFSGDLGTGITPGTGKIINADLSAVTIPALPAFKVRIIADDGQPLDIQALVDQVDSTRLKNDLLFVEGIRHRTAGAAHLGAVRDSMAQLFRESGIHQGMQTWAYGNYTARNVIGTHRGIGESEKVVIIDAHYDTVSNAPGADDNGSGVVGVLEAQRLLSRYASNKTLRFIGFDLEESGLLGSTRYVTNGIPAGENIEGVLNFEMIGYYSTEPNSQTLPAGFNLLFPTEYAEVSNNDFKGDFITNVGNVNSASLVNLFTASADTYVPELRVVDLQVPGNGQLAPDLTRSDHAPFWTYGAKALMLTDGANFRNECYHTPQDTASEKLSFTFMANVVKATIATAAQLAEVKHAGWGTATFDAPVSVDETINCNPQWRLTGDQLRLSLEHCTVNDAHLSVTDAAGRLIWEYQTASLSNGQYQYQLPQMPNGVYILQLKTKQGNWAQKVSR